MFSDFCSNDKLGFMCMKAMFFSIALFVLLINSGIVCQAAEKSEVTEEDFLEKINGAVGYSKDKGISVNDLLMYLREGEYSSFYWEKVVGLLEENTKSKLDACKDAVWLKERGSNVSRICGNEFEIAHLFAALECESSGLGSLGGWHGDLCELAGRIAEQPEKERWALDNIGSSGSGFECSDIKTDELASILSKGMCHENDLGDCFQEFYDFGNDKSLTDVFLFYEFGLIHPTQDEIEKAVLDSFNKDQLMPFLLLTFNANNSDAQIAASAFSSYLFDNSIKDCLGDECECKSYGDLFSKRILKLSQKLKTRNAFYKKASLAKELASQGGFEAIERFLKKDTKGYFSK